MDCNFVMRIKHFLMKH